MRRVAPAGAWTGQSSTPGLNWTDSRKLALLGFRLTAGLVVTGIVLLPQPFVREWLRYRKVEPVSPADRPAAQSPCTRE